MKDKSHIIWPAFIIAILAGSVIANVWLIVSANSDGGARPIPNYYDKAVLESEKSMNPENK